MSFGKFVVGKCGFGKFASRQIWCQKICFGKFGVGKSVSENSVSEKSPRPKYFTVRKYTRYMMNALFIKYLTVRKYTRYIMNALFNSSGDVQTTKPICSRVELGFIGTPRRTRAIGRAMLTPLVAWRNLSNQWSNAANLGGWWKHPYVILIAGIWPLNLLIN